MKILLDIICEGHSTSFVYQVSDAITKMEEIDNGDEDDDVFRLNNHQPMRVDDDLVINILLNIIYIISR